MTLLEQKGAQREEIGVDGRVDRTLNFKTGDCCFLRWDAYVGPC